MRAGRAVATVCVAWLLAGASPGSWAAADRSSSVIGGDGPGTNELELQVGRLDRASQADVVGAESSSMLFSPGEARAIAAARSTVGAERQAAVRSLFTGPPVALHVPTSTRRLFPDADPPARTRRASTDDPRDIVDRGSALWATSGLTLLVVAGAALSRTIREPGGSDDG
ncbi:hypothetical protein AGMMS50218_11010 [Actinomycetota bacterium]|nr:hypothetical protein AGMMS50218_11010 [Actinomycetota bacterium]